MYAENGVNPLWCDKSLSSVGLIGCKIHNNNLIISPLLLTYLLYSDTSMAFFSVIENPKISHTTVASIYARYTTGHMQLTTRTPSSPRTPSGEKTYEADRKSYTSLMWASHSLLGWSDVLSVWCEPHVVYWVDALSKRSKQIETNFCNNSIFHSHFTHMLTPRRHL